MSANMFGYCAAPRTSLPRLGAQQGSRCTPARRRAGGRLRRRPSTDFTLLPANARLQAGTPPRGLVRVLRLDRAVPERALDLQVPRRLGQGLDLDVHRARARSSTPNCWPNATPANASTPANAADVLAISAMAQAQYSNIGGAESLWVDHTVSATSAPRTRTATRDRRQRQRPLVPGERHRRHRRRQRRPGRDLRPGGANTFFRFMPSLAVDRVGDMAIGYTKSNSTTNPQIKYAGRLAGDPVNTLGQTEQTLIDGTGAQSGNCGGAACTRWGDYSGMALDPNGCDVLGDRRVLRRRPASTTRRGSARSTTRAARRSATARSRAPSPTGATRSSGATVTLGSRTTTTERERQLLVHASRPGRTRR